MPVQTFELLRYTLNNTAATQSKKTKANSDVATPPPTTCSPFAPTAKNKVIISDIIQSFKTLNEITAYSHNSAILP